MDSHVMHPVGITATLAELGYPQISQIHTDSSSLRKSGPGESADYFICNVGERYVPEPNEWLGSPRTTKFFNEEQLAKEGIRGLYTKGPQSS